VGLTNHFLPDRHALGVIVPRFRAGPRWSRSMDPDRNDDRRPIDAAALLWLRTTLFIALFISAFGALVSFRSLFIYVGTLAGAIDLVEGTAEYRLFEVIQGNPVPRLGLEVFNLILWLGVLIGATRLLRLQEWARKFIKTLITIDLFVTLGVACLPVVARWVSEGPVNAYVTVDVLITTVEVIIVLVLSHPRVVMLTVTQGGRRRQMREAADLHER